MAIVPESPPVHHPFTLDASDTALDRVADRAYGVLGACDGRLAKAVALVRSGAVTITGPHYAMVQSQSDPASLYHVNPGCVCDDAIHRATDGRCKHVLASWLGHRLAKPHVVPQPPVVPLPEAPASCNCYVTIAGRQVQLTVRGHDASALLTELAALLQRFPVETASLAPTPTPANAPQAGWCTVHATPMKLNNKNGRTWYSHQVADGTWCKGTH